MADHRRVDDSDLDAVLGRLMAVEPSSAFLPRVRDRIARERPVRAAPTRWLIGACSTAALAAVAATLVLSPREASLSRPVAVSTTAAGEAIAREPARDRPIARYGSSASLLRGPRGQRGPRGPRPSAHSAAAEPRVIVDARQRSAVALLMRMVGDGTLTREAFERTTVPSESPIREQVAPIGIEPVAVSPMAVGGVLSPEPDRN